MTDSDLIDFNMKIVKLIDDFLTKQESEEDKSIANAAIGGAAAIILETLPERDIDIFLENFKQMKEQVNRDIIKWNDDFEKMIGGEDDEEAFKAD